MKYMLLIYGTEGTLTEDETSDCYQRSTVLAHDLKASGAFVATSPLQGVASAQSVQVRGGQRIVTDGPFAETREQLGGYFLVDVENQEEAISIAERIPGANWGTVEVRPVVELPNIPTA